ncbi:glycoside hydrolase family 3 C-terminal domain-containing protein [Microbacterium sp. LWS13-1.2]|uniref:Exo-alpha-(1->6)-L-arabinopyranosidase n=1 Tax=Microbacterium sp. LWS13-1.2 TaxID=3135264 RepID=A0AAU6S8M6_9MICO
MNRDASIPAQSWATDEVEARVNALLGEMTLDEKIAFVTGGLNWNYAFYARPLERLGIPALQMADGPAGVRVNRGDVHEGKATALPAPIALAATWDPELAWEYGTVIGAEARATDHNVSLGPAVDIARVPLGGRTFESYGEDPRLAAAIGVAFVRAVQAQGVQACAKHFAINNQEDHRTSIDAVIDERTMRELYLPPFEALIREGDVASMMGSFNRINGTFACENPTLLTDILRGAFGFRGWVMSDYGANHSTAPAINAGLDQEQPAEGHWGGQLWHGVQNGEVAETTLDESVRRILRPLIGLGQLESPASLGEFPEDEHHLIAQRIAEASMVLLRNDGILPLSGVRRVALIGTDVDTAGAKGGGSSLVRATREISPLEGLTRAFGDGVEIGLAFGAEPVTPGVLLPGPPTVPEAFFSTPDGKRGLVSEWWTSTDHSGEPLVSRVDGLIEHNLGAHNFPGFNAGSPRYEPLPGELNGQSSARWTGTLTVPVTGTYLFTVTALGRFSFELGETVVASSDTTSMRNSTTAEVDASRSTLAVIDGADATELEAHERAGVQPYNWGGDGGGSAAMYDVSIVLVAGRPYRVRLEYAADDPSQGFLLGARIRLGWMPPAGVVSPDIIAAAELAAASDVAIVVVRTYEAESDDRPSMLLPSGQDALVRAVLAANPRTVVVLMTGAPVDMTDWGAEPAALVQAWFPGQAQGDALARVLTGSVEPGGRLPLTLPRDLSQTPGATVAQYPGVDGKAHYSEGVFVGYRAVRSDGAQPAFPFGHGLAYTSFAYEELVVEAGTREAIATLSVTVRNVGPRAGSEVVQVYVGELPVDVPTPERQLAAFRKLHLEPGATARVTLEIPARAVSYFDVATHDWVIADGIVDVLIGASSQDIRLTSSIPVGASRSVEEWVPDSAAGWEESDPTVVGAMP